MRRTEQTDKTLDEHDQRLTALERSRGPLPAVAALTAVGAPGLTVWQALGQ